MSRSAPTAVNNAEIGAAFFFLAPLLNVYGISGVGMFDLLVVVALPFLLKSNGISRSQLFLVFGLSFVLLLSGLINGVDASGMMQSTKFIIYLLVGSVIRVYYAETDISVAAKFCIGFIAFGFAIQIILLQFGIYESLVLNRFGVNEHLANTNLDAYMSKDTRLTSFFVEPAHLSVWLIFMSAVLISREQLTKNWLIAIVLMLFLSGSSFGFGFGAFLVIYFLPSVYKVLVIFLAIIVGAGFAIYYDVASLLTNASDLVKLAPQIARLVDNEAAVSGRTGEVNLEDLSAIKIVLGQGLFGTHGYLPFFVRIMNWGGIAALTLIFLSFRSLVWQNKKTREFILVILVLMFLSGSLSTVNVIILFLILPSLTASPKRDRQLASI